MAKKIKIGIIGLGWPGREHLKGYKQCADAEVVALCDMNTELAGQQTKEHDIAHLFTDHKQMFKEIDLDAGSVCLPNFLHAPITLDALKAGKHVICEKPPALDAKQARKMADTAKKNKLTLMYALCLRFGGAAKLAKDYIEQGELGEIYYGRAVYHRRRGIPMGSGSWFVDKKRSGGGALIDIGVHALDSAWWLMGCPKPVSVSGSAYQKFKRVLPKGAHAMVDAGLWDQPRLMAFLQAQGAIEPEEMARTFNCGVGMVLAVEPAQAEMVRTRIEEAGDTVLAVGEIVEGERGCTVRGAAGVWSARADWEAVHNA